MGDHYERCVSRVREFAHGLAERIVKGEVNEFIFDGQIRSFLNQPAYYIADWYSLEKEARAVLAEVKSKHGRR